MSAWSGSRDAFNNFGTRYNFGKDEVNHFNFGKLTLLFQTFNVKKINIKMHFSSNKFLISYSSLRK